MKVSFIKKLLSVSLTLMLVFWSFAPTLVLAETSAPSAPTAPTAPAAPAVPSAPEAPTAPSEPEPSPDEPPPPPPAPESPAADPAPSQTSTQPPSSNTNGEAAPTSSTQEQSLESQVTDSTTQPETSGQTLNGQSGESVIKTQTATNTVVVTTLANSNFSANSNPATSASGSPVTLSNAGNGADSTNDSSALATSQSDLQQTNLGGVRNSVEQKTETGENTVLGSMGGAFIQTGDANTTGTAVTGLNTNLDGVSVSEFNVVDDHRGDVILDFSGSCITGCGGQIPGNVNNSGNGADSLNNTGLDSTSGSNVFQNNDGTVGNTLTLTADSGTNKASQNTGGDSTIKTGNANVSGNALTFLNNNLSGEVIYGVVNIFGNLVGDIVLPSEALAASNTSAVNTGNGAGSENTATANMAADSTVSQENLAQINNNLNLSASTGSNATNQNTNGDAVVKTGNSDVNANVLNVANSNIDGGTSWLVLVNNAGVWSGQILGGAPGSNYAGSSGMDFNVTPSGDVNVSNSGNGSDSANSAATTSSADSNVSQSNSGKIENNLNLSANSGGNDSSKNTGGNSFISTGDAKVVANIVNFVNNNIVSGGKLVVAVVNVFGSWVGDFVTPGSHKDKPAGSSTETPVQNPVGGAAPENTAMVGANGTQSDTPIASTETEETVLVNSSKNSSIGGKVLSASRRIGSTLGAAAPAQALSDLSEVAMQKVSGARRVVSLNLAWLLILLPLLALAVALYRNRRSIALRLYQGGALAANVSKGLSYFLFVLIGMVLRK